MSRQTLTVLIPTFNVERYLDKQLTDLEGFADEILICDSFSTDSTLAIATRHGVRVIQHEYINSAKQKNWAIPQAASEWVLILDSDEWLEPELMDEIRTFLANPPAEVDLGWMPRKNLFWGEWHGPTVDYPDRQSRLFRRDKGRYDGREVHSHVTVPGKTASFRHHIIHDDFTDISSWWLKMNRYLRYELQEIHKRGKRWRFRNQFLFPVVLFFRHYIRRCGFRHGFPGFFRCFLKALTYFMIYAKVYEYDLSQRHPDKFREKSANPH